MTAQQDFAAEARSRAGMFPAGSLGRKAWACAGVALSTTGTTPAARRVLAMVTDPDVRRAALAALDQLAGDVTERPDAEPELRTSDASDAPPERCRHCIVGAP